MTETAKLAANGRRLSLPAAVLVTPWPATAAHHCARKTIIAEVTPVRDGDTIETGGLPIRLHGLAARGEGVRRLRGHQGDARDGARAGGSGLSSTGDGRAIVAPGSVAWTAPTSAR